MKRASLTALILVSISIAAGSGYWAGTHWHPTDPNAVSETMDTSSKPARKILYYRNPMGLPDTSPTPKKDEMGMDYLPVYEGNEPDDTGAVKVSPDRMQTLGVQTVPATMKTLDVAVHAVGKIDVNERSIRDIAPRFDGWIEHLYVNATGDTVHKGQALFTVYSPEIASAYKEQSIARELEQTLQSADPEARRQAAQLTEAAHTRLRHWDMSGGRRGKDASQVTYSAPVDGIVLDKKAIEGMRFQAGTPLYRIADLSTVWVMADVYEHDLAHISVGQPVQISIDAIPDKTFDAKVAFIYPTLNEATRTTPIRMVLANPDGKLRPGMFAHVDLSTGGGKSRLTVPLTAVLDDGSKQVVLLDQGGGKFTPHTVKLGVQGKDDVEVLDGLNEGDRVVVSANFLIDSESNLKAALASFTSKADSAYPVYHAQGVLDAIDVSSGMVTITHQPIPELNWPSMTMNFDLAQINLVKGIPPKTPIRFDFEARAPGEYVVTQIKPADR